MRLALVLLAVLTLTLPTAASSSGDPLTWQLWQKGPWKYTLDTQPGVENTLYPPCAWNDQDDLAYRATGRLDGVDTKDICLVADFDDSTKGNMPKQVAVKVMAPTDTLSLRLSNDAGDSWAVPAPVKDEYRRWVWSLCVTDPVADAHDSDLLSYPVIPNTNGGRGQPVTYTLETTSAGRTTRDIVAVLEVHGSGPAHQAPRILDDVPCPDTDGQ